MGCHAHRMAVHRRDVLYSDNDRVRAIFSVLYIRHLRLSLCPPSPVNRVRMWASPFIKSYCAVCLEGAVIVLFCIIFSVFASSPPVVDTNAAAVTQVWSYVAELIFNMLVLVGAVKMSDRIIREMMGL